MGHHSRDDQHRARDARRTERGFTLIELLVVVVIMAAIYQVTASNLSVLLPEQALDKAANTLAAQLDFTRSEARINSRAYQLQVDVTNDRWRFVPPPEERRTSHQFISDDIEDQALGWTSFPDGIDLTGAVASGRDTVRNDLFTVTFDENGFTADHMFFFVIEGQDDLVWTVQYYGLTGVVEILESESGVEYYIDEVTEGDF